MLNIIQTGIPCGYRFRLFHLTLGSRLGEGEGTGSREFVQAFNDFGSSPTLMEMREMPFIFERHT